VQAGLNPATSYFLEKMMEVKKMHPSIITSPDPTILRYVMGAFKGSGKTLGEVAAHARQFENEMNAWIDMVDAKEGRK